MSGRTIFCGRHRHGVPHDPSIIATTQSVGIPRSAIRHQFPASHSSTELAHKQQPRPKKKMNLTYPRESFLSGVDFGPNERLGSCDVPILISSESAISLIRAGQTVKKTACNFDASCAILYHQLVCPKFVSPKTHLFEATGRNLQLRNRYPCS